MLRIGYKIPVFVFVLICCACLFGTSVSYAKTSADVMDNTHVYQKDEKYKSVSCYQQTANVYSSGCGLISINHAINFINETDKSIETMIAEIDGQIDRNNRITAVYYKRFLNSNSNFYSGATADTPKIIAEYYGLVASRYNVTDDIDTFEQTLNDGHCIWMSGIGDVFIGVDGKNQNRNGHCVMFYRYEDGLFYCHDSCEKQYTTYTREQLEALQKSSVTRCGTWFISKEELMPDNVDNFILTSGNGEGNVYAENPGDISGYQIRYRIAGEQDWIVETYPGDYDDLDVNIVDYNSDARYQVQVRTFYKKGIGTYYSSWTSTKAMKIKAYKAPTVREFKLKPGNGQFNISAEKPADISGYEIRYRESGKDNWIVNSYDSSENLNTNVKELKAATKYQVQVRTFLNRDEYTYYSNWTLYKVVKTNNAPGGTKVKTLVQESPKSFTITADKTPSITGYEVAYRIKDAKSWTKIKFKTKEDLNKTVSGLKAKTYHVKVRTYRTVGKKTYYSGWSGWKAIIVKSKLPEKLPEENKDIIPETPEDNEIVIPETPEDDEIVIPETPVENE